MQKTIKIIFDVTDVRYRARFLGLTAQIRELQVPNMCQPVVEEFIQDWVSIFEKYNIPASVVRVTYVGERFIYE